MRYYLQSVTWVGNMDYQHLSSHQYGNEILVTKRPLRTESGRITSNWYLTLHGYHFTLDAARRAATRLFGTLYPIRVHDDFAYGDNCYGYDVDFADLVETWFDSDREAWHMHADDCFYESRDELLERLRQGEDLWTLAEELDSAALTDTEDSRRAGIVLHGTLDYLKALHTEIAPENKETER